MLSAILSAVSLEALRAPLLAPPVAPTHYSRSAPQGQLSRSGALRICRVLPRSGSLRTQRARAYADHLAMMLASAAFAVGSICVERAVRPPNGSGSFDWNDVVIGDDAACGVDKCYFASKTGATGYLVSEKLDKVGESWSFASCLKQRYGLKHFLLAPQRYVRVSEKVRARLTPMHVTRNSSNKTTTSAFHLHHGHHSLAVQKAQAAPASAIPIACSRLKRRFTAASLPAFREAVRDDATFRRLLNASLRASLAAIWNEPCLLWDFQAFLTQEGHIIHIDVDRCYDKAILNQNGTLSMIWWKTDHALKAGYFGHVRSCLLGLWAWLTGEVPSPHGTAPEPAAAHGIKRFWEKAEEEAARSVRLLPFLRPSSAPTAKQEQHRP